MINFYDLGILATRLFLEYSLMSRIVTCSMNFERSNAFTESEKYDSYVVTRENRRP